MFPAKIPNKYMAHIQYDINGVQESYSLSDHIDDWRSIHTLEGAIDELHKIHHVGSKTHWTRISIAETHAVTSEFVNEDGHDVFRTDLIRNPKAYVEDRPEADYKKCVLDVEAAYQQSRIDSGEESLKEAYLAESAANEKRAANGEPLVFDAYLDYYNIRDWDITPGSDVDIYRKNLERAKNPTVTYRLKKLFSF
jgi:hypothetical protein